MQVAPTLKTALEVSPFIVIGAHGGRYAAFGTMGAGSLFYTRRRPKQEPFGYSVAVLDDVNADGSPDFIVGAAGTNSCGTGLRGSVHVFSGADGALLLSEDGRGANDEFGAVVAGIADLNGDGKGEFAVVAPCADPDGRRDAGSVYVFASP